VAALALYWRLAESDITVMPSVMCTDRLCWWYKHVADVVPLQQHWLLLPRVRNINIHPLVQSKWTISIEKKSDVISWLEKGEWIVPICCNVRFAHSNMYNSQ